MNNLEVPHFEIDIDENGIQLEAHGYKGNSCVKESEKLEAAIGSGTSRNYKAAFYQKVIAPIKNRLGMGGMGR